MRFNTISFIGNLEVAYFLDHPYMCAIQVFRWRRSYATRALAMWLRLMKCVVSAAENHQLAVERASSLAVQCTHYFYSLNFID